MMTRLLVIAKSVAGDAFRRRLVYVVIFFAIVMSFAIPYLPSFGVGIIGQVYREVALAVAFVAGLVVSVSLVSTRIPSDIDRRTIYATLTKPVSRAEYVIGTWLGIAGTLLWVVAAFIVVAQVAGAIAYGEANWRLWQAGLAIWAELGVLSAFGVALSSRVGVVPVSLGMLVLAFVGHARAALLTPEDGMLWRLYPSLDAFNIINPVAHGSGVDAAYLGSMLLVFAAYCALLLVAGAALFGGRDL